MHRENLPQIRASFDDSGRVEGLAKAFRSPVILNADLRDGSLREAAANLGVPVLVYEGGEALRFSELAIRAGVRGVLGVLRALGMLGGAKRSPRAGPGQPEAVIATSSQWVRAPQSGILRVPRPLGTRVEKGDNLGWIADPLGDNEIGVESPTAGIIRFLPVRRLLKNSVPSPISIAAAGSLGYSCPRPGVGRSGGVKEQIV